MNKKINKALNSIKPTDYQKNKIYNNILNKSSKPWLKYNIITFATCCIFCFGLYIIQNNKINNIVPRSLNNINYDNKCYVNSDDNYIIGNKIGDVTIRGDKYDVYENKLGGIVVDINNYYEVYKECEDK